MHLRTLRPPAHVRPVGFCVALELGVLLLVLAACGADSLAEPTPPAGIEVPRVGTLGPVPRGPGTIAVDVTVDGRISVDGLEVVGLLGLRDRLVDLTPLGEDRLRWHTADGRSRKVVLLNADAELPWSAVSWILRVIGEPTVRIDQVFLGALAEGDETYGAFGILLPGDTRGPRPTKDPPQRVVLHIEPWDGAAAPPEAILPALEAQLPASSPSSACLVLHLHVEQRGLPAGYVVRLLDMAQRAGVGEVAFEGFPYATAFDARDAVATRTRIAELRARLGRPRVRTEDGNWAASPDPAHVPAPRGRRRASELPLPLQVWFIFGLVEAEDEEGE